MDHIFGIFLALTVQTDEDVAVATFEAPSAYVALELIVIVVLVGLEDSDEVVADFFACEVHLALRALHYLKLNGLVLLFNHCLQLRFLSGLGSLRLVSTSCFLLSRLTLFDTSTLAGLCCLI